MADVMRRNRRETQQNWRPYLWMESEFGCTRKALVHSRRSSQEEGRKEPYFSMESEVGYTKEVLYGRGIFPSIFTRGEVQRSAQERFRCFDESLECFRNAFLSL
jgi:hypothetical protein